MERIVELELVSVVVREQSLFADGPQLNESAVDALFKSSGS